MLSQLITNEHSKISKWEARLCPMLDTTIAQSLPFFYFLIQRLNDDTPDFSELGKIGKSGAITKAAWIAEKKLLRYFYMSSDADALHSVATILDLRFKIDYFRRAGWTISQINEMNGQAPDLWNLLYKPNQKGVRKSTDNERPQPGSSSVVDMLWFVVSSASQSANENEISIDEFELYLQEPLVLNSNFSCSLPEWWKKKEEKFPNLSHMGNDILAIPATSVPVERQFAGLVDIITPVRASLHAEAIQMLHEALSRSKMHVDSLYDKRFSVKNGEETSFQIT
ncbi:hypothetical protein DAPPUDRAFT_253175 [Daphnia pulex]|uniref:HAT C-terminal dimerisation domain-containing protein n=1 Tax=Daphnia pulex TaxID=6669 RepID=E9H4A5_DAPPU|nr:hypothetical protein DAPPUDRAFT_253175 [Daphnia pulex]|eukprot:EFX73346.1 hypothetical protein DAPPUDRAFT_253175 [Daphnia pulex]